MWEPDAAEEHRPALEPSMGDVWQDEVLAEEARVWDALLERLSTSQTVLTPADLEPLLTLSRFHF